MEPRSIAWLEEAVPAGGQQATGLVRSLSWEVTGSKRCLRKINLAVHAGWVEAKRLEARRPAGRLCDQPGKK